MGESALKRRRKIWHMPSLALDGNRMDERYVEPGVPVKAKGKTRYLVMVLRAKS